MKRTHSRRTRRTKRTQPYWLFQLVRGLVVTVVVGIITTLIWYGTRHEAVTITDVHITPGPTVPEATLRAVVERELGGAYYALIPRRFTYLYPQTDITASVTALERVEAVALDRPDRQTLSLVVTEYEPYALWCSTDDANCLFIDPSGYAFTQAPPLRGGALTRYFTTATPVVGEVALPAQLVLDTEAFITTVRAELGMNIVEVVVTENDLTYQVVGGGELRTSRRMTVDETVANVQTVLQSPEFAHLGPGSFGYIDLRYGNRVYVRESTDEELATSSTSTVPQLTGE